MPCVYHIPQNVTLTFCIQGGKGLATLNLTLRKFQLCIALMARWHEAIDLARYPGSLSYRSITIYTRTLNAALRGAA